MVIRANCLAFIASAALLVPLAACDSPAGVDDPGRLSVQEVAASARVQAVSTPLKAHAYTDLAGLAPDPACGDPPRFLNTQVGEGEATHLGRFSVTFTFCVDATDLLDDGTLTEGESAPYDNGIGTIVAADGDELYLAISGVVLPSSHPDFDFEFHDSFVVTGGTGRFAGAAGQGVTDSFVDQSLDRTYHQWRGWLTVRPGR